VGRRRRLQRQPETIRDDVHRIAVRGVVLSLPETSGAFFGAKAFEFVAYEVDVATLCGHETDDRTKRGGLTYTVSTHETEDGFLRHVEVDST
jgi:hypothetical protein